MFTTHSQRLAHFSIHMYPECIKSNRGRIHVQNNINTQRTHTIKVNRNNQNKIRLSLTSYPTVIRAQLKDPINVIINVLSLYLNSQSDHFLGLQRTHYGIIHHPAYKNILSQFSCSKTPLRHTLKSLTRV